MGSHFPHQKIFEIGLSVETVSLYLLCRGLHDAGKTISTKNLMEVWNGSKEEFVSGLKILCDKKIVQKIISDVKNEEKEEQAVYRLTDVHQWKV
jgi:hypothetical protein